MSHTKWQRPQRKLMTEMLEGFWRMNKLIKLNYCVLRILVISQSSVGKVRLKVAFLHLHSLLVWSFINGKLPLCKDLTFLLHSTFITLLCTEECILKRTRCHLLQGLVHHLYCTPQWWEPISILTSHTIVKWNSHLTSNHSLKWMIKKHFDSESLLYFAVCHLLALISKHHGNWP